MAETRTDPGFSAVTSAMEVAFLTFGQNVPDPVTGEQRSDADRHHLLIRQAIAAENAGFDVFQVGEHHFNHFVLSAPEVILSAIAQHTNRIRLGTGVTTITTLDPILVAERFATLDILSRGRAELAVGRGAFAATFEAMGTSQSDAQEIFIESTELLWRLLNEVDVKWEGRWHAPLDGITIRPRPIQRSIPLWSASTTSLDLAARLGLGAEWVAPYQPVSVLSSVSSRYREAWAEADRTSETCKIRLCVHFHVARTSQEARRRFRPYHTTYIEQNSALVSSSFKRGFAGAPNRGFDALINPTGPIIPFCGSRDEVVNRIGAARDLLKLTGIVLAIDMGGMSEKTVLDQIDMCAEDIFPVLTKL